MATMRKALTGKRVYRMSSHAPTRGTNNPKGYVERELRNRNKPQMAQKVQPLKKAEPLKKQMPGTHGISRVGKDGQSDTRSGLAARTMKIKPRIGTALSIRQHKPPVNKAGKVSLMHAPLTTPGYKPIAINNNGRLDLPFDYSAAQNALEQQQKANQDLVGLQTQSQEHAQNYLKTLRDTQQGFGEQQRQTLNDNAARGTAFSSGYGMQVGNNANQFNNQVNDLNAENTTFNNGIEAQRNQINTGLQDYLRQQATARGVQLAPQLGTLGYGTSMRTNAVKPRAKKAVVKKRGRR